MVHTAEITTNINKAEFIQIRIHGKHETVKEDETGTIIHNYSLSEYGISCVKAYMIPQPNGENVYQCTAQMNLERVSSGGKRSRKLFQTNDIEQIVLLYDNFKIFMDKLLPSRAELSSWKLKRIDYAVDIKTKYVTEYIYLLKKGNKPASMQIPEGNQHKSPEKRFHFPTNIKYENKAATINIYDKYAERLAEQERRGITDREELEDCKNILRVEIQCYRNKTNYIKSKYKLSSKEIGEFLYFPELDKDILLKNLKAVCGTADYYTYAAATERISTICTDKRKTKTKNGMLNVLEQINGRSGTKSVWKAQMRFAESLNAYCHILEMLEEEGVNPATLPNNTAIPKNEIPLSNLFPIVQKMLMTI